MSIHTLLKVFLGLLLYLIHSLWFTAINTSVPEPYLDEIFHVPQAQAYWAGNWTVYDPKITTPPGLYGFSHAINCVLVTAIRHDPVQTTKDLRTTSSIFLVLLYLTLRHFRNMKQRVEETSILTPELNVVLFPLSYVCWAQGQTFSSITAKVFFRCSYVALGIAAITTRQTNVFWVAIFMGGLQLIRTVSIMTQRPLGPHIAEGSIEGEGPPFNSRM